MCLNIIMAWFLRSGYIYIGKILLFIYMYNVYVDKACYLLKIALLNKQTNTSCWHLKSLALKETLSLLSDVNTTPDVLAMFAIRSGSPPPNTLRPASRINLSMLIWTAHNILTWVAARRNRASGWRWRSWKIKCYEMI